MKASELRIGNIITIVSAEYWVGEITSITHTKEEYKISNDNVQNISIECCKPIPLTEEWLVKFGFEHVGFISNKILSTNGGNNGFDGAIEFKNDNDSVLKYNDKIYFVIDINSDDYGNNYTVKEVNYVHQIQNLYFAFTGEELTTK